MYNPSLGNMNEITYSHMHRGYPNGAQPIDPQTGAPYGI